MTTSPTVTCRDIDELLPVARQACILFFYECWKAKIKIFVTETYRSQERQNYLYAQGRTRPGNIVTWTLTSNHKSRLAWDIGAAQLDGNTNIYDSTILKKAGAIAKKLNIVWGGTWTNNLDYPHFEVPTTWKPPAGYTVSGKVSIPTRSTGAITVVGATNQLPNVDLGADKNTTDKEENKVGNYMPKISDATAPTLKTSFINTLKQALSDGRINDANWVKAAEDGTLSVVDTVLLLNHINRPPSVADMSSVTLKETAAKFVGNAIKDGHLSSTDWEKKAKDGTLSLVDLIGLQMTVDQRKVEKAAAQAKK